MCSGIRQYLVSRAVFEQRDDLFNQLTMSFLYVCAEWVVRLKFLKITTLYLNQVHRHAFLPLTLGLDP